MRREEYAPGTVARIIVILRYIFNLAVKWKVVPTERTPHRGYLCRLMYNAVAI